MIAELKDYYCPVNNILKEIDKLGRADYKNAIDDIEFINRNINYDLQRRKIIPKIYFIIQEFDLDIKKLNKILVTEDELKIMYNE